MPPPHERTAVGETSPGAPPPERPALGEASSHASRRPYSLNPKIASNHFLFLNSFPYHVFFKVITVTCQNKDFSSSDP